MTLFLVWSITSVWGTPPLHVTHQLSHFSLPIPDRAPGPPQSLSVHPLVRMRLHFRIGPGVYPTAHTGLYGVEGGASRPRGRNNVHPSPCAKPHELGVAEGEAQKAEAQGEGWG